MFIEWLEISKKLNKVAETKEVFVKGEGFKSGTLVLDPIPAKVLNCRT